MEAAKIGHKDVVQTLIQHGADFNAKENGGKEILATSKWKKYQFRYLFRVHKSFNSSTLWTQRCSWNTVATWGRY